MQRLYGKYEPIPEDVQKTINELYESFGDKNKEEEERKIAYEVASDNSLINQDVLFAGATSINDAYMIRNTHSVHDYQTGKTIRSLKLRDFKDDVTEKEVKDFIVANPNEIEVVMKDIQPGDIDKRKNFEVTKPTLYRIKSGKHAGMCFAVGKKDGQNAIFLDIANTPFEKLTSGWQESNFDPFEFAYKLVNTYPELTEDQSAAIVHVYWLTSNGWAIEYKDPMAVPYCMLDKKEQVKDGDNVVIARGYKKELAKHKSVNQEICKDICRIARAQIEKRVNKDKEQDLGRNQ